MGFLGRKSKTQRLFYSAVSIAIVLIIGLFAFINHKNKTQAYAEVNSDEWNLGLVYYDSTVNNGLTELTSETVNVENTPDRRTIYFQINYDGDTLSRSYAPGELSIKLELPFALSRTSSSQYYYGHITDDLGYDQAIEITYTSQYVIDAKQKGRDADKDYDWEYECVDKNGTDRTGYCEFKNLKTVEQDSSVQGSIQLAFEIGSNEITTGVMFKDTYIGNSHFDIKATLNGAIDSNNVTFDYNKTINSVWTKEKYSIYIKPEKIDSFDGLGANAADYIWVHYYYMGSPLWYTNNSPLNSPYEEPYNNGTAPSETYSRARQMRAIPVQDWHWEEEFPDDVIVLNASKQQMTPENGKYIVSEAGINSTKPCVVPSGSSTEKQPSCTEIFVAYPKSTYLNTTVYNTVNSRGIYFFETDESQLDSDSADVDLSEFYLEYHGNDAKIQKSLYTTADINYEQLKSSTGANITYALNGQFKNSSESTYDLVIGDDVLYYEDLSTGEVTRLSDNDYSFGTVYIPTEITAANNEFFDCDSHEIEVYYRLRNQQNYQRYSLYSGYNKPCGWYHNGSYTSSISWKLPTNTVAWKIVVPNVTQAIEDYPLRVTVNVKSQDLPQSGSLTNFAYIEANSEGVTLNTPTIDSYADGITKDIVAAYDQETYNKYMQRAFATKVWEPYQIGDIYSSIKKTNISLQSNTPSYNPATDGFESTYTSRDSPYQVVSNKETNWEVLKDYFPDDKYFRHLTTYDLLPAGVQVLSSAQEIHDSWTCESYRYVQNLKAKDGRPIFNNEDECQEFILSHSTVTIQENYDGTGRTIIRYDYDFSEKPFSPIADNSAAMGYHTVRYRVPFDTYIENKNATYQLLGYGEYLDSETEDLCRHYYGSEYYGSYSSLCYNPTSDPYDIDRDGDTNDYFSHTTSQFRIMSATSTDQSIIETIKTDQSSTYVTTESFTGLGSEYNYKLSLRTGANRITDTIIYDNLETAYGDNPYWQGIFNGVDTSFANSQTDFDGDSIRVKVYYSESPTAGSLSTDDSWHEYIEGTTPKQSVKSIAFQYLKENGQPAVIASNSALNTIVKMTAISDNDNPNKTYNAFRSEWTAINPDTGQPVAGIVGLNSNTTSAKLDRLFDIHVENEWIDNNDERNFRPTSMVYTLKRGGATDNTHELSSSATIDSFDFEDLHLYDEANYSVPTPEAPEHYSVSVEHEEGSRNYKFIYTLEDDLDIHVVHVWIDRDNAYGFRPENVDYTLTKNGTTEDTQTSSPNWTADFLNLHRPDESQYGVNDVTVEHYSTTKEYDPSTHTYTFTSTLSDKFDIIVKHNWIDEDNVRNLRPESVTYTLNKDSESASTMTLGPTNTQDTFANLDLLDEDKYSVPDVTVEHYSTTKSYDASTHTYTFEHTLTDDLDFHVVHIWIDNNNAFGKRPNGLTYTLNKEGGDSQTQNSSPNWTADFLNLYRPDENKYSVPTPNVQYYDTTVDYNAETHTYTFTSTYNETFDIHVIHNWIDNNNAYGRRPESYDYKLLKESATSDTKTSSSNWTADFSSLPLLDESKYSVETPSIQYYDTTVEYDPDTHTYIFTSTLNEKFTININHVWIDDNDKNHLRPTSVDYELTKEGNHADSTTSSSNWTANFSDLPLLDESKYAVPTPSVEHYTTTADYAPDTHTYTFTSTLSELVDITVKQVWIDENNVRNLRPESLTYTLKKGDENVNTLSLSNDAQDTFNNVDLLTIAQYDVPQFDVEHYSVVRNYDADTRIYTFTYTLIDDLDIHVVHVWIDRDNAYGLRPESVEYTLTKNGATDKTANSSAEWTADFINLRRPDESQYGVNDVTVEHYSTTKEYDPDTHTYTFTSTLSDKFDIEIIHIWDDLDDKFGLRPDSVDYELAKDGATDQTTTSGSDWTTGFTNLPLLDKELYAVLMPTTPDDYTTTVEVTNDGKTYTFTSKLNIFNFNVVNIWKDNGNAGNTRPDSLSFNLEYNEETEDTHDIETTDNEVRFAFEELLKSKQGNYMVTLTESPEGYTTEISFDEETMTITFIHTLIPKEENTGSTPLTFDRILFFVGTFVVSILGAFFSIAAIGKATEEA